MVHKIDPNELQISIATARGWCAFGDSMLVAKSQTDYTFFPSSCSPEGKPVSMATAQADWSELIRLLDLEKFNAINLNECNTCADGLDETVTIQQGAYKHFIRYGSKDNERLKEIKPFIEKLQAIRNVVLAVKKNE